MPRIRLDILPYFVIVKKLLYIDAYGRRKVSQRTKTRGGLFEARRIPRGREGEGTEGVRGRGREGSPVDPNISPRGGLRITSRRNVWIHGIPFWWDVGRAPTLTRPIHPQLIHHCRYRQWCINWGADGSGEGGVWRSTSPSLRLCA